MKDLIVPLLRHIVAWLLFLQQKFTPFAKFDESDLPCYKALDAELDLWETYWFNNTSINKY